MICPWRKRKIRMEKPSAEGVVEEEYFMECEERDCPFYRQYEYDEEKCARASKDKRKR